MIRSTIQSNVFTNNNDIFVPCQLFVLGGDNGLAGVQLVTVASDQRPGIVDVGGQSFWGTAIGGALRGAGRLLAGKGANLARAGATRAGATRAGAATGAGAQGILGKGLGGAQKVLGRAGLQAGRGLASSGRALAANPAGALWGGTKNFGSGAMMLQGKGLGGALGKGAFGLTAYNALSGPGKMQNS